MRAAAVVGKEGLGMSDRNDRRDWGLEVGEGKLADNGLSASSNPQSLIRNPQSRRSERLDNPNPSSALDADLREHYCSYAETCALGTWLKRRGVTPRFMAGYSMGLYATLYHCGALSFEEGLCLMRHVCTWRREAAADGSYGMAAVVGFTPEEMGGVITAHGLAAKFSDVCGPRAIIASGRRDELERLLEICRAAGSLQGKLLPVGIPFHSSFLRSVGPRVREFVRTLSLASPRCDVLSCVDQQVLSSADLVREEIVGNAWRPMHWHATMNRLIELARTCSWSAGRATPCATCAAHVARHRRVSSAEVRAVVRRRGTGCRHAEGGDMSGVSHGGSWDAGPVRRWRQGPAVYLQLHRPEKANAYTREMLGLLRLGAGRSGRRAGPRRGDLRGGRRGVLCRGGPRRIADVPIRWCRSGSVQRGGVRGRGPVPAGDAGGHRRGGGGRRPGIGPGLRYPHRLGRRRVLLAGAGSGVDPRGGRNAAAVCAP